MILYAMSRWPKRTVLVLGLLFVLGFDSHAHAASTTDVIEAMLYTYSSDKVAWLFSLESVLWNIMKRRPMKDLGGRGQGLMPIRTRNTGIFHGITEAGTLTTRRSQPDTTEASFSLQEFEGVVDVSWKMLQDMRNSKMAFQTGLDFIDAAKRARSARLLNAELLGYGRGELGILPAADDQAVVTVRAMPQVDMGLIIDLMDDTDDNALLIDGQPVTDFDVDTNEITTVTTVSGSAAGDYYTVADSVSTAGSLHMTGIMAWIDTANPKAVVGNLGGINRSTAGNGFWKATKLTNSGTNRPLTEDLLLQAFDSARKKGGEPVNRLMSNLNLIRRYHEILREDVFFALGSVKGLDSGVGIGREESAMKGGADGDGGTIYKFSGVPWHAEPFFDANRMIGFNDDHFWIAHGENELPQALSDIFDGQVQFFRQTTSATFDMVDYWQAELICDAPNSAFQISDLAES